MSAAEGSITSGLLKSFAEGMASDIGGNIGGLLLGSIFPAGGLPVDDLAALCDEIKQIMTTALTAEDIKTINGNLTGLLDYLKNEYPVKKNDPSNSKQTLTDDLLRYKQPLEMDVLGQFTGNADRTLAGFPVYLLAVYSYVAYLQELAMVDPDHADPWQSDYVQIIRNELNNTHIPWCKTQWATLQSNRKAKVSVQSHTDIDGGDGPIYRPPKISTCWWWTDTVAPEYSSSKYCGDHYAPDQEAQARAECAARQQQVQAWLVSDMGDPDSVIAQWQQVAAQPLPLPSKAKINSFTAKWTGSLLTLAWDTTGAASIKLFVSAPLEIPDLENVLNQDLSVEATGTRDFGFADPARLEAATLSCTDVDGLEVEKNATFT